MPEVQSIPTPDLVPGDVIASDLYMGTVISAFWDETWCYNIGDNATVEKEDKEKGYRAGPKYIRRGDVKWRLRNGAWRKV